jgi:Protein of unknown function (DUF2911)
MNRILLLFIGLLSGCITMAQDVKIPALDKSPMDMSYFPDQYPIQKFQGKTTAAPTIRVIYGRPQKDSREIFGELIKYNEIWRVGANEATEIEFYKDVKIDGKKVLKGRYTLYCIPAETHWTFIINKDTDSWGAFKYDAKKDLLRVKVPVKAMDTTVEALSIYFEKTSTGAKLDISWDKSSAALPITF